MKISFLVTTHNETEVLIAILGQLEKYLKDTDHDDEVVILDDYSDVKSTQEIIQNYKKIPGFKVVQHKLDVHTDGFGGHKQFGNEHCEGDYIFQVDADEYFSESLLYNLKDLLTTNPTVDLFLIPRVNIIRGLTEWNYAKFGWHISKLTDFSDTTVFNDREDEYKFLKKFGFVINEHHISETQLHVTYNLPIINWKSGDYQFRLYKNSCNIQWKRPLHELIVGAEVQTYLPIDPKWALIHDKTMERQEQQNNFYMTEFSKEMNTRS